MKLDRGESQPALQLQCNTSLETDALGVR